MVMHKADPAGAVSTDYNHTIIIVISVAGQIPLAYIPPEIGDGLALLERLLQVDARAAQWAGMLLRGVSYGSILLVTLPAAVFTAINRGTFWIKHGSPPFSQTKACRGKKRSRTRASTPVTKLANSPAIFKRWIKADPCHRIHPTGSKATGRSLLGVCRAGVGLTCDRSTAV
jgi:hypothetical protein